MGGIIRNKRGKFFDYGYWMTPLHGYAGADFTLRFGLKFDLYNLWLVETLQYNVSTNKNFSRTFYKKQSAENFYRIY